MYEERKKMRLHAIQLKFFSTQDLSQKLFQVTLEVWRHVLISIICSALVLKLSQNLSQNLPHSCTLKSKCLLNSTPAEDERRRRPRSGEPNNVSEETEMKNSLRPSLHQYHPSGRAEEDFFRHRSHSSYSV